MVTSPAIMRDFVGTMYKVGTMEKPISCLICNNTPCVIMKIVITSVVLLVAIAASSAHAESVPDWIQSTAAWWAEGLTSDAEFVGAIQYLVAEGVITVQSTEPAVETSEGIPDWIQSTAAWWAEGLTSDAEFVGAIQYLVNSGIISVGQQDSQMAELEAQLLACSEYTKAYMRLDCEDAVEKQMTFLEYERNSVQYDVGPVTYYFPGSDLEITAAGQPLLTIRMLVYNGGTDNVTLVCSGPAVCNYDVTDGSNVYKYAATDFTSGSITIPPEDHREFMIMFGPNIGYGGTTFVYDSAKEYHFRINESFGSLQVPLNLN